VVSSPTAAGYGDFSRQLLENEWGLSFRVKLFPAIMQGQQVPESITSALLQIADEADKWDAVVIIRGGGATSDLIDYDSYYLAACIAQHPLPVITGIGHDRDQTVPDMVAHTSVKTPTAAAAFILEHQLAHLSLLQDLQQRIPQAAHSYLQQAQHRFGLLCHRLPTGATFMLQKELQRMKHLSAFLPRFAQTSLVRETHRLELLEHRLKASDPNLLLKRGYSITLSPDGEIITDVSMIRPGERIVTRLQGGEVTSEVKLVSKNKI
jgi:exodeoxyribonuclease VII large subunit